MTDPSPLNFAEALAGQEPAKTPDLTKLWFLDPDFMPLAAPGVSPPTRDEQYRILAEHFLALLPPSIVTKITAKGEAYGGKGEHLLSALYESLDEVITWKENEWNLSPRAHAS